MNRALAFEDVLASLDKFSVEQKFILFEKLRMDTFIQKFEKLSQEISSPKLSETEILAEVKTLRKRMYGKKN